MTKRDNVFSSKPKQIAQAAIKVSTNVFGDLEKIKLIVMSDMKLPFTIAENFKSHVIKNYDVSDNFFKDENYLKNKSFTESDVSIDLLKSYDVLMIGFKNQSKIIDKLFVRKLLKIRKQKPIFFIDCGIPGSIYLNVGKIANCFLFDLNDLEQLYSSWIQNNVIDDNSTDIIYDLELKKLLEVFFKKLNFNLEQKTIFEKRINNLLKSNDNDLKILLKKFFKII
ncbi:MAG: hypothetical protein ACJ0G4_02725 [Alphaproteobacteria bacterium]